MKSILRRRPSPALVISMIALFVSLSGVSYGVATGFIDSREIKNNEIRSLDIRNNEVRTRDLRNNEIRGIDIRNSTVQGRDVALNTLTGDDVKENTLGKVPSATSADSATTAGSVSTLRIIPRTTMTEGAAPVTLATHGPLTLTARACQWRGRPVPGSTCVQTTENNSAACGGYRLTAWRLHRAPCWTPAMARRGSPPRTRPWRRRGSIASTRRLAASAPSGKALHAARSRLLVDASGAGSCTFHGHLALQG